MTRAVLLFLAFVSVRAEARDLFDLFAGIDFVTTEYRDEVSHGRLASTLYSVGAEAGGAGGLFFGGVVGMEPNGTGLKGDLFVKFEPLWDWIVSPYAVASASGIVLKRFCETTISSGGERVEDCHYWSNSGAMVGGGLRWRYDEHASATLQYTVRRSEGADLNAVWLGVTVR